MFKYGYQGMITNQYNHMVDCGDGVYCDLLVTRFKFPDQQWLNYFLLAAIGLVFRVLAYFALEAISSPKRIKMGNNKGKGKGQDLSVPVLLQSAQMLNPPINNPALPSSHSFYPNISPSSLPPPTFLDTIPEN